MTAKHCGSIILVLEDLIYILFPAIAGRGATGSVSPQEEEELRTLASTPSVYDSLARSLAPSIYGSDDLKKAIACLLFGGSRKRLEPRAGSFTFSHVT